MPNSQHLPRPSLVRAAHLLIALGLTVGGCASKRDDKPAAGSATTAGAKASASGDKAAGATTAPTAAATDGALGGACDRREREKLCAEYRGAFAKPARIAEECAAQQVPFLPDGCPKEGAVARCIRDRGTPSQTDAVYYAPVTRETVTALCAGGIVGEP